jgi:hypothetical protein
MRSTFAILAAGFGVLLTQAQPAAAQFINPYNNMGRTQQQAPYSSTYPGLSPYLNLTRGGNPAANYYLGVLPEFQRRNFEGAVLQALPGLEANAGAAAQQPLGGEIPVLGQTGHLTAFGAYGAYYNYPTQQRTFYPLNPNQARMLPR